MNSEQQNDYDVIVVGSGPAGATVAYQLSQNGQKVLILERGNDKSFKEGLRNFTTIGRMTKLGDNLSAVSASTVGGTSSLYFAAADSPDIEAFAAMGIDLTEPLQWAKQNLPIAPLSESLLTPQAKLVRQSAEQLGFEWQQRDMLIDQEMASDGYRYDAKFNAKSFIHLAQEAGATLISEATVTKILLEGNTATGVEYQVRISKKETEKHQRFGGKIIIAAGTSNTPKLLRSCGIEGIGEQGFYCDPGLAVFGLVPNLKGKEGYPGCMGTERSGEVVIGDANFHRFFHRMMMLSRFKLRHLFQYAKTVGVGVLYKDGLGGKFNADGSYHKDLSKVDMEKLNQGEIQARQIIEATGAKHIFASPITASHPGGLLQFGKHFDQNLQTPLANLHICDGSLLSVDVRMSPTLTIICLAKYLADKLSK